MPKKTLARIDEGVTAASVAYGCAALLDAGLEEQLGPATAEEEGLGCGGSLAVRIARRLQYLKHHLEVCQEGLERIRDELRPWRGRRDETKDVLYDRAKNLRKSCRAAFGAGEGDAFLGLHGSLPREPKELHAAFGPVVGRLADARWPMPKFRMEGWKIKRDKLVRQLSDAHRELGSALAAIQEGETREAVAKAAKKRAKTAHDAFLDKSTRYLVAAMELGGLEDLAATVRPGAGKPGRPRKELAGAPSSLPGGGAALPPAPERARLPAAEAAPKTENETA